MTNKELYDLTKYLFESWERGADYDNYHMDCQYVLDALAQPEQEPVFLIDDDAGGWIESNESEYSKTEEVNRWLLYTTSPKRDWLALTDGEIQQCYKAAYKVVQGRRLELTFARTLETYLREKNT